MDACGLDLWGLGFIFGHSGPRGSEFISGHSLFGSSGPFLDVWSSGIILGHSGFNFGRLVFLGHSMCVFGMFGVQPRTSKPPMFKNHECLNLDVRG